MEAFEISFLISSKKGKKKTSSRKTFAATGWEAAKEVENFMHRAQRGMKYEFIDWEVLDPGKCHFSYKAKK